MPYKPGQNFPANRVSANEKSKLKGQRIFTQSSGTKKITKARQNVTPTVLNPNMRNTNVTKTQQGNPFKSHAGTTNTQGDTSTIRDAEVDNTGDSNCTTRDAELENTQVDDSTASDIEIEDFQEGISFASNAKVGKSKKALEIEEKQRKAKEKRETAFEEHRVAQEIADRRARAQQQQELEAAELERLNIALQRHEKGRRALWEGWRVI